MDNNGKSKGYNALKDNKEHQALATYKALKNELNFSFKNALAKNPREQKRLLELQKKLLYEVDKTASEALKIDIDNI